MSQIIWSEEALADIQRLYRFRAAKNISAAQKAIETIRQSICQLAHPLLMGRAAPEVVSAREKIFPFSHGSYIVLYTVIGKLILIFAIRHYKEAGYSIYQ